MRLATALVATLVACSPLPTAGTPKAAPPVAPSSAQSGVPCVVGSPPSQAASNPAQGPPAPPATFDVAAIDAYIAAQMAPRGFVGLSVAIAKDGVLVLDKGYGQSRLAPDVPVTADTPFEIASITKQFVSSMVLLLAEEKKLSLDDKVAKYFPDLTRASDITLYDLMTHVSGYRDSGPLPSGRALAVATLGNKRRSSSASSIPLNNHLPCQPRRGCPRKRAAHRTDAHAGRLRDRAVRATENPLLTNDLPRAAHRHSLRRHRPV